MFPSLPCCVHRKVSRLPWGRAFGCLRHDQAQGAYMSSLPRCTSWRLRMHRVKPAPLVAGGIWSSDRTPNARCTVRPVRFLSRQIAVRPLDAPAPALRAFYLVSLCVVCPCRLYPRRTLCSRVSRARRSSNPSPSVAAVSQIAGFPGIVSPLPPKPFRAGPFRPVHIYCGSSVQVADK